jgi:hypothetical protein
LKRALDASNVRAARPGFLELPLPIGTPAAPPMRSRVEVVHEPRLRPDRGADSQSLILSSDEHLPVIVDERLAQRGEISKASSMKQNCVPAQPLGHPRDRGLCAVIRPCDLAVSGARRESRSHRDQKRRPFEVVGRRERLPRARPPACAASEARDVFGIARLSVPAVTLEPATRAAMRDALRPRTKRRHEPGGTYRFDGMPWPAHDGGQSKDSAGAKDRKFRLSVSEPRPERPARTTFAYRASTSSRPPWVRGRCRSCSVR